MKYMWIIAGSLFLKSKPFPTLRMNQRREQCLLILIRRRSRNVLLIR